MQNLSSLSAINEAAYTPQLRLTKLLLAAICSSTLLSFSFSANAATAKVQTTPSQPSTKVSEINYVRASIVKPAETPPPLPFSGTVRAADNAPLAFQAGGRLKSLEIDVGQKVKTGELLAILDNPELGPAANAATARVNELKARVAQALRDVKRIRSLRQSGVAGQAELERSQENFDVLNASLATAKAEAVRARQLLQETKLYAPFDGEISRVFVEPGQTISAGKTVLAIDGSGGLEIEIGVPSKQMKLLEIGREIPIKQFGAPLTTKAKVIHIASTRVRNQLHRVIAAIPQSDELQAGATITLLLPSLANATLLEIPVRAVVDTGRGVPRVFIIHDDHVQSVQIELHQVLGSTVLISGPLEVGDRLVTEGLAGLQDGNKVVVLP